jgi:hypothetical protein
MFQGIVKTKMKVIHQLKILNIQLALFFKQRLVRPDRIYQNLNSKMNDVFDNPPTILPVPDDISADDIPIVVLNSTKKISCTFTRSRVDLQFDIETDQPYHTVKKNISQYINSFLQFFYDSEKLEINRAGYIVRYFVEDLNPLEKISSILDSNISSLFDGELTNVAIQYAKIRKFDSSIKFNDFLDIRRITNIQTSTNAVMIVRDFNTLPDDIILTQEKIQSFITFSESNQKIDNILSIVWPS